MRKVILLLPLAIALATVFAFALVQQNQGEAASGGEPSGVPPAPVSYACYFAPAPLLGAPVIVDNQYESSEITVLDPIYLCPPTDKDAGGLPSLPTLSCYVAASPFPGVTGLSVTTQFEPAFPLDVGPLEFFCTEADKLVPTPTPTPTATPTVTPTPTKQPFKGDTDGDGCADVNENLPKAQSNNGGGRDYMDPWDYYDVSGLTPGVPDGVIDLGFDILGVISHYAPTGTEPAYDVRYDRGPSTGPNAWNMTAPDGFIDLGFDILGVILQYQPLGCV